VGNLKGLRWSQLAFAQKGFAFALPLTFNPVREHSTDLLFGEYTFLLHSSPVFTFTRVVS
jgi:hypothetical protein